MNKKFLNLVLVAVLGLATVPNLPMARAEATICTTDDLAGMLDNIIVPKGATCTLLPGVWIAGNVNVGDGASLIASSIPIGKNVHANGAARVMLEYVTVSGNVNIQKTNLPGATSIVSSEINGNLVIEGQRAGFIEVIGSQIEGDVMIKENITVGTPASIGDNTIDGNLQCQRNSPSPVPTAPNSVLGSKQGQCSEALGF